MDKQNISVRMNLAAFAFGLPGVSDRQNYIKALREELASVSDYADNFVVNALSVTGPNPLQYSGWGLGDLITTLRKILPFQADAEITVNALPGSVIYADILALRDNGVKRINFDMRSFVQDELDTLGRTYSPSAIEVFMRMVQRKITFFNYDVTLYYGLPGQTVESLNYSLEKAIQYMAMHITLLPYEDEEGPQRQTLYQEAVKTIGLTNFEQYTPYHFARPGYASLWNKLTYSNQPSLGLGVGVDWKVDGMYCKNTSDVAAYMAAEGNPSDTIVLAEEITQNMIESDAMKDELFNLRACDLASVTPELRARAMSLCERGFLVMEDNHIGMTLAGKADWRAVSTALTI
jgi:oxygen-independent coproporphyrinogen III oxidase